MPCPVVLGNHTFSDAVSGLDIQNVPATRPSRKGVNQKRTLFLALSSWSSSPIVEGLGHPTLTTKSRDHFLRIFFAHGADLVFSQTVNLQSQPIIVQLS